MNIKSKTINVSVLLFTFNHEKWISKAIDSILMQKTNFDFEIVILEDLSTDKTREIVVNYQRKYPEQIKLILSEYNKCDNTNAIKAIESSNAEYIAFLDGDDHWTSPDKLQKQVDFLDNHQDFALCFHNVRVFYEDKKHEDYNNNPDDQKTVTNIKDIIEFCYIKTSSAMIRKRLVPNIPDWFLSIKLPDWALFVLYAQYGKIGYINEVMSCWRIHEKGYWSGLSTILQLQSFIDFYLGMNVNLNYKYNSIFKKLLSVYYYRLAIEYQQLSELDKAKNNIIKSFISFPFNNGIAYKERLYFLNTVLKNLSNEHFNSAMKKMNEDKINEAKTDICKSFLIYPFFNGISYTERFKTWWSIYYN